MQKLSIASAVILIPAFNEEEVIGGVIGEIQSYTDIQIVVIDDASTDTTIACATKAGATVIPLPVQLGAWGATQTGLRYALRRGFETVISMDADGQHGPKSLASLAQPVMENIADVSIGTCTQRGSKMRKIAWVMMKQASGLSLEDITSGFRVYNKKAILELASWRATLLDYQDIGVLLLLQSRGVKIVDVEVEMNLRINGPSRVFHSWVMVMYYMCHSLLLGLTKRSLTKQHPSSKPQ